MTAEPANTLPASYSGPGPVRSGMVADFRKRVEKKECGWCTNANAVLGTKSDAGTGRKPGDMTQAMSDRQRCVAGEAAECRRKPQKNAEKRNKTQQNVGNHKRLQKLSLNSTHLQTFAFMLSAH